MCHKRAPETQTNVSLNGSINATYSKVVEYTIHVWNECKNRYEAPYVFGIRRMMLESKVRKWLRTYSLKK